jgi:uncharacterized protein YpuA (DUF1002 family)
MKKFITGLLAMVMMLSVLPVHRVKAVEKEDRVLVVGAALNEEEISQTKELLSIAKEDTIEVHKVTGEDIYRFLNQKDVSDSVMVSSVLVKFNTSDGVRTAIETPQAITDVKSYQYSNAAITAGLKDCEVRVASIRPVTGESALTGIYKAAEVYGIQLDQDRLIAGNDELETVQDIEKSNTENKDFNSEDFSKALTQIKLEITNQVDQSSKTEINTGDIVVIINNVLDKYDLNLSEEDINKLAEMLDKYKDTLNSDNLQEVRDQLEEFGKKTWDLATDAFKKAEEMGLWDKIVNFFRDLIKSIQDMF